MTHNTRNIREMFDVSPTISAKECYNKVVTMSAPKRRKTAFRVAYVPAFALLVVLGAIMFGSFFRDTSPKFGEFGELHIGRYTHVSGGTADYIEVFDDGTLQIFGFNFFEHRMNSSSYQRELDKMTPEEREKQIQRTKNFVDMFYSRGTYHHSEGNRILVEGDGREFSVHRLDEDTLALVFDEDDMVVFRLSRW
jgi:hypothetical protein